MYQSKLSIIETERGIDLIKTNFTEQLEKELKLIRVSAPKFIKTETGIQDDLAGTCDSVKFMIGKQEVEIVHSLAKWKRIMLKKYNIEKNTGIWTDMDAIRKDEDLDDIHSAYVDQYDWEMNIGEENRNLDFLIMIVEKIYDAIKKTKEIVNKQFKQLKFKLPEAITFVHSEDLQMWYPKLSPKEREKIITQKCGAVFLIGIGYPTNGKQHDLRAVDYDDWSTNTKANYHGLNGDILVWDYVRDDVLELSSMGIRVNKLALEEQMKIMKFNNIKDYHKMILNDELPLSIGGGIGQSRLSMLLLEKKHIGEVQVSEWPLEILLKCKEEGIDLL